jgi:hypothetical protein
MTYTRTEVIIHFVSRERGCRDALAMNPQTAARKRAYLDFARHRADICGPLFRRVKAQLEAPRLAPAHGPGRDRPRGAQVC